MRQWGRYGVALALVCSLSTRVSNGLVLRSSTAQATDSVSVKEEPFFQQLASNVSTCLLKSELKRDSGFDGASTGWTSWVEESSAQALQSCMNLLCLADSDSSEERDNLLRWIQWMKACPSPMTMEFSTDLRHAVSQCVDESDLEMIDSTRDEFLGRIRCRLILLPSGMKLSQPLRTPPGAMAYGKLLYGGVTRYRLIGSTRRRRAGERTLIYSPDIDSWLQYGGPERNYQAVDMGPCALIEVILTPKGMWLPLLVEEENTQMAFSNPGMKPLTMFDSASISTEINETAEGAVLDVQLTHERYSDVDDMHWTFKSRVGGLVPQIESIVRRVLDGRVVAPSCDSENGSARAHEARVLSEFGLKPVRGLLLYGPPGCGKTALAREISNCLNARPPKIVEAPSLLDRWVGGSERLVRELFADAEAELSRCNGDPTKSALHVVVIDEIDAVFRRRSASQDSGEATRASAVNQILAKLDGVHELGNVLVIGMTNQKELLDHALLRPGRLEVQIEIPLPDQEGRREILQMHFEALRKRNRLSQPLCRAIDGNDHDVIQRTFWKRQAGGSKWPIRDLASQRWTGGFSGADIAGLVRCSGSLALARARFGGDGVESLLITLEDVRLALEEVKR